MKVLNIVFKNELYSFLDKNNLNPFIQLYTAWVNGNLG
mgnify:CR=1 FL=1